MTTDLKRKSRPCEKHLIVWDWKNPTVHDDNDAVTFDGICDRCSRSFQVTFTEPKYSILEINSDEWQNYTMLGTEVFAN